MGRPQLGGYRVNLTEDQLKNAPKFNRSTDWGLEQS